MSREKLQDLKNLHRPKKSSSRIWVAIAFLLGLCFIFAERPYSAACSLKASAKDALFSCSGSEERINECLDEVLDEVPLIDGHNDWAFFFRYLFRGHIYGYLEDATLPSQTDLRRLKEGRVGGQFWSVYMPCPELESPNNVSSTVEYLPTLRDTFQQIDIVHRLIERFPHRLVLTPTVRSIIDNFRASTLKNPLWKSREPRAISSMLGVEGLHQIGNSMAALRQMYGMGVRYATLTHNCHNRYADAAIAGPGQPAEGLHGGLADPFGYLVIREMNRMGMIVDLSHTSAATQHDALAASFAPVIYSHSSAHALCAHPRNVKDAQLEQLRANGGVVMVAFLRDFVRCDGEGDEPGEGHLKASVRDVADHIMYVGARIGFQHVGIGSDFNGDAQFPEGIEDVSKFPELLRELLRRGVSKTELKWIAGGNLLRVFEGVEKVKMQMATQMPLEDNI